MSDLGKIATAEPVFLTDGSAQQVVITTALPASSSAGLAVREVSQGQQTSANSRPVVIASDQSALSVNYSNTDTYAVAVYNTSVTISANTVSSFAYLWHPSGVTKTYYLQKIVFNTNASGGAGQAAVRVTRITAENATPGGTLVAPLAFNSASPSSGATFRFGATGAPTRSSTDVFVRIFTGNVASTHILDIPIDIIPMTCRGGVAEGWEVRLDVATNLSGLKASAQFVWTEA